MKGLIPILLICFYGCINTNIGSIQHFPEYAFSINCPCELVRDTVAEEIVNKKTGGYSHILQCMDSVSADEYRMNILLTNSAKFLPSEIMDAVESTLNEKGIPHERRRFENKEAVCIDYSHSMELEIFTSDLSYYFVVSAEDSLQEKFERSIATLKLK